VPDAPYRAPLPIRADPYLVAWEDLRRRRRLSEATMALCSVVGLLSAATLGVNAPFAVLPACIVGTAMALYPKEFTCPRCRRRFAASNRRHRDPSRCHHCGIEIGTPKSAVIDAEKLAGA
jgi:hypothetical protein